MKQWGGKNRGENQKEKSNETINEKNRKEKSAKIEKENWKRKSSSKTKEIRWEEIRCSSEVCKSWKTSTRWATNLVRLRTKKKKREEFDPVARSAPGIEEINQDTDA